MSPLEQAARSVARRWLVVIACAVIGVAVAAAWSTTTARTTWTATGALTTQSQERAPEQDAVLALGYVNYFNQPSYQQQLRARLPIGADVALEAKAGATSPILYIAATARTEEAARAAATLATETFRDDVRTSLVSERERAAADLQAHVDAAVKLLGRPGYNDGIVLDQIRSLQGRITDIDADNTNLLKQLQPAPGLASDSPSATLGIVAGGVGGLVVGLLIALLLGSLDRRLRHPDDIRRRTGLETLAVWGRELDEQALAGQAASVVTALTLAAAGDRSVIAVIAPRRSSTASVVARQLASAAAGRRSGSLLVRADPNANGADLVGRGLADVLDGRAGVTSASARQSDGLLVLDPGAFSSRHQHDLLDPGRVAELAGATRDAAGLVVVESPPMLESAQAQVLAAAADRVVLVVDRNVSRVPDVEAAWRMLDGIGADVAGAIIVDRRKLTARASRPVATPGVDVPDPAERTTPSPATARSASG